MITKYEDLIKKTKTELEKQEKLMATYKTNMNKTKDKAKKEDGTHLSDKNKIKIETIRLKYQNAKKQVALKTFTLKKYERALIKRKK